METLRSFCVLLVAQCAGEVMRKVLHLPVPGPVLGMALLAAALLFRRRDLDPSLVQTANTLLRWLGLLFVPAGVGVVVYLDVLRKQWLPVSVALLVSTFLTFAVTGLVLQTWQRTARRAA